MRSSGPCLCGDPECRACFPAREHRPMPPKRCRTCGRFYCADGYCAPCGERDAEAYIARAEIRAEGGFSQ